MSVRSTLEGRAPYCSLDEKASGDIRKWMTDDDALERASDADWFLLPSGDRMPEGGSTTTASGRQLLGVSCQDGACTVVGSEGCGEEEGKAAVVVCSEVAPRHAHIHCSTGAFHLTDLGSPSGTWITRVDGARMKATPHTPVRLHPGDTLQFGTREEVRQGEVMQG